VYWKLPKVAQQPAFVQYLPAFLCELAEAEALLGRTIEALAVIEGALERAEQTKERWYFPELLRVKGEIELHRGGGSRDTAESLFLQSTECACGQEALAWELRTARDVSRPHLIRALGLKVLLQSGSAPPATSAWSPW
jgi:predicted ATPase